jgi:hypothetical protein
VDSAVVEEAGLRVASDVMRIEGEEWDCNMERGCGMRVLSSDRK